MTRDRHVLFKLIEQAGTLATLAAFLKSKGLPHSASSWEAVFRERVVPALTEHKLSESALYEYLRDAEEFGRQHTFLFGRLDATTPPDDRRVRSWLRSMRAGDVMDNPIIVEYPDEPVIADVRREPVNGRDAVVVKTVETRQYRTRLGERVVSPTKLIVEYELELARAVNIARIHGDGLVELRVYSHRNSTLEYRDEVNKLLQLIAGLIDINRLRPVSLGRAKDRLWLDRNKLRDRVRYSNSELRNDRGSVLQGATGSDQDDLFDDEAADHSLRLFADESNAYCHALNIWWRARGGALPSKDIHMWLSGEAHEFAVTTKCTRDDYNHVLTELRRLNR